MGLTPDENNFTSGINKTLKPVTDFIERILKISVGLLVVFLVVVSIIAVVFRYIFQLPIVGIEELSRFAMVWMVFLGSAVALRRGAHIAFHEEEEVTDRSKLILRLTLTVCVAIFLGVISYYTVMMAISLKRLESPNLGIPLYLFFIGPLMGFFMGMLFAIEKVLLIGGKLYSHSELQS